ncbi:MAG TPA: helix-turn-helix domain-containing protein [Spirochaetota bacterium]|nr:helix-turn-helix domain-containing protein [Spirochaetota bacterium]
MKDNLETNIRRSSPQEGVRTASAKGRKRPVKLPEGHETLQEVIDRVENEHIRRTLELTNWNLQKTSRVLDIARNTLKAKIRKYEIG